MRRFVRDGPELPYSVLQAHEEDRLVFFCGAGISYYTGLPGFKHLVSDAYARCGHPLTSDPEQASTPEEWAFHSDRLDQAFHLLEQAVGRDIARRHAIEILSQPPKRGSGTVKLHKALLTLAEMREGGFRLVTTNFDDRFFRAHHKAGPVAEAPRLGWPRVGAWRHLTYLHGRIDETEPTGEDLILSSGDFGRAYLTEGWASRFLVELFRQYTVLFIGYSLNDPVLRYMVDALATDMREGRFREPFAIAGLPNGEEEEAHEGWTAKGVTPILFPTGQKGDDYSLQDKTIIRWAAHHAGGLDTRISVARETANSPYVKTPDDDELKNLAWALSKKDGSVARAFAESNPSPHISWLEPLSNHEIPTSRRKSDVTLLRLPSPPPVEAEIEGYHIAPLAGNDAACLRALPIDAVTNHLGRWLCNHREEAELVNWVVERRGIVHPDWAFRLSQGLDNINEPWRSFWRIIVDGLTIPPCGNHRADNYRIASRFRKGEWPDGADQLVLRAADSWVEPEKPLALYEPREPPQRMRDVVSFRLKLSNDGLLKDLCNGSGHDVIRNELAKLADPLTSQLACALRLAVRAHVFEATEYTHLRLPAIADTEPKRAIETWETLARLVREAFESLVERDHHSAETLAARWRVLWRIDRLNVFQRLAVHALTELNITLSKEATSFLLDDDGSVLWNYSSWPEVARFLRLKGMSLRKVDRQQIAAAVARGPSMNTFPSFRGNSEDFKAFADELRTRRAVVLFQTGFKLTRRLTSMAGERLLHERPEAQEERHHRAQVSWVAPATADELVSKNIEEICSSLIQEPGWDAGHRLADLAKRDLDNALHVIRALVVRSDNPTLWEIGLDGLRECEDPDARTKVITAFQRLGEVHGEWLVNLAAPPISRVLASFAEKLGPEEETRFLDLWDMTWAAAETKSVSALVEPSEPIEEAINAPGGNLAEALLDRLFARELRVGSGLPPDLEWRFSRMWQGEADAHRHARIILASRVLWLHRIDKQWVQRLILPAMASGREAPNLWLAMLWLGKWDIELVGELEESLRNVASLIKSGPTGLDDQLSEWIASILINAPQALSESTISTFFHSVDVHGLGQMVWVFDRSLDDAGDRAANLWAERIKPIFHKYWPADIHKKPAELSRNLLRMALSSRNAFPDVINELERKGLIVPDSADSLLFNIVDLSDDEDYDIVSHHPLATLKALTLSVGESGVRGETSSLKRVTDRIASIDPDLANDARLVRLGEIAARG